MPLTLSAQKLPQIPQWLAVVKLVSHPLLGSPSQSPNPALHVKPHCPPEQLETALATSGHGVQLPQCETSAEVSTLHPLLGSPSQSPNPRLHVKPHCPLEQLEAALATLGHDAPQLSQFKTSVEESASYPLLGSPSQSPNPRLHVKLHCSPEQLGAALATSGHGTPQLPQLDTDVDKSTSHPLLGSPSQSAKSPMHAKVQFPLEQ
jgi:hypothetical protein